MNKRADIIERWNHELENVDNKIFQSLITNWKSMGQAYTRNFSYEVLLRGVYTNTKKFRYGTAISDMCMLCNKFPETISHILCDCEVSSGFWNTNIKTLLEALIGHNIEMTKKFILFSETNENQNVRPLVTYIMQTARWAIWEFRYLKSNNLNPIHPYSNFKNTVRKNLSYINICLSFSPKKNFDVVKLTFANM